MVKKLKNKRWILKKLTIKDNLPFNKKMKEGEMKNKYTPIPF